MTSTKDSPSTDTEDTSTPVLPTDTPQPTTTGPARPEDLPGDGDGDDDIPAIDLFILSISPLSPAPPRRSTSPSPLLQPLSAPAVLAARHSPSSSHGPELLDITALGGAWRRALSGLLPPPAAVTFDLTLPRPAPAPAEGDADAVPRAHWATSMGPRGVAVAVEQVGVMRLVVALASAAWVRRGGRGVRFDVVYGAGDDPSRRVVEGLRRQLDGIGRLLTYNLICIVQNI